MARKRQKTDGSAYAGTIFDVHVALYIRLSVEDNKKTGLLSRKSKDWY